MTDSPPDDANTWEAVPPYGPPTGPPLTPAGPPPSPDTSFPSSDPGGYHLADPFPPAYDQRPPGYGPPPPYGSAGNPPPSPYGTPAPYGAPPSYGAPTPYGSPYSPTPYGAPYAQPGYGYGSAGPKNDGLAIAAMITSIVGVVLLCACIGIAGTVAGAIMGYIARNRIQDSNGMLTGEGFALAGIVVGAIGTVFGLLYIGWAVVS